MEDVMSEGTEKIKRKRQTKEQTDLVIIERGEPRVSTLRIAEELKVNHKDKVARLLKKYDEDFLESGTLEQLMLESTGGRPVVYYMLNKEQARLIVFYMRNYPKVRELKKRLNKEFTRLEKRISDLEMERRFRQQEPEWNQARIEGKVSRRFLTDVIDEKLIPLAIKQDSRTAKEDPDKFFLSYSAMENREMLIIDPSVKNKNKRNYMDTKTLKIIDLVEIKMGETITECVDKELHYKKDIFPAVKAEVKRYADFFGKQNIPPLQIESSSGNLVLKIEAPKPAVPQIDKPKFELVP